MCKIELDRIYNMDCLDGLKGMDDACVDLTVTSPPYDNLREYGGAISQWNFIKFRKIADELYRVTKDGGVVVWIVSDGTVDGSETLTSFRQALYFKKIGFSVYDTMIWEKPSPAAPTEGRYYDVFEYMFVLCKGKKPKSLHLIADRVNLSAGTVSDRETRSCREDRKTTGEKRTVADVSRRFNVWNVSRGHNLSTHPAVFPATLVKDHIRTWSDEGGVVLDPFMGSGTTAIAAIDLGRRFVGFEINEDYYKESISVVDIAKRQVKLF